MTALHPAGKVKTRTLCKTKTAKGAAPGSRYICPFFRSPCAIEATARHRRKDKVKIVWMR